MRWIVGIVCALVGHRRKGGLGRHAGYLPIEGCYVAAWRAVCERCGTSYRETLRGEQGR